MGTDKKISKTPVLDPTRFGPVPGTCANPGKFKKMQEKINFLVKNINSYIFLIFLIIIFEFVGIFENLFEFYWVIFEF
jgi:hypothetical protein